MQPANNFWLTVHHSVFGDIEAKHFEPGANLHQILYQKALGAADIEHAVAGLKAEMLYHVFGNGHPAPIIAIAAVTVFAWPVEIDLAVFARNTDVLISFGSGARIQVALPARQLGEQMDFIHTVAP